MAKFWKHGVQFSCQQCGNCCTHTGGGVYASKSEFEAIAKRLNMTFESFLERYTEVDESYVTLTSREDGPCIFYDEGCTIYEDRPTQCRNYPFWPEIMKSEFRWNEESKQCAGMNSGRVWLKEEILKALQSDQIDLYKIER